MPLKKNNPTIIRIENFVSVNFDPQIGFKVGTHEETSPCD